MTNSEARKRMQARSGPESPLSRPQTANLGDGANGRLNERAVVDALLACLPMHEDGTGHVADCGYDWDAPTRCGCYTLPDQLAAIVREHTERALAEVEEAIASSVSPNFALRHDGSEDPQAAAYVEGLHDAHQIVRAARQERGQ